MFYSINYRLSEILEIFLQIGTDMAFMHDTKTTRLYREYMKKSKTAKRSVVLSDVDGTVVKGSLVLQHAVSMHDNGLINLGELPAMWLSDQKNEEYIGKLAEGYREAVTGMSLEDMGVSQFIDSIFNEKDSFYTTLNRLIEHKSSGSDVYLVSGSPDYLVGGLADKFGFNVAASKYHFDSRGLLTGKVDGMFHADAKRDFVGTMSLQPDNSVFAYGDTSSDVPLFEAAGYSVLVAPNDKTRSALSSTVNEIVEK